MKELLHRFSKVEIASGLPIMPSHEDNFSSPVRASGAVDPVHLADPTDLAARVFKLDSELKLVKRRADSWEQTAKDQGKELTRMKAKLAASNKKWEEMDAKLRKTVDINNLFAGFFTGKVSPEQVCYPFHPPFLFCLGLSPTLPMPHPVEPRPFGSDRDLVSFGVHASFNPFDASELLANASVSHPDHQGHGSHAPRLNMKTRFPSR